MWENTNTLKENACLWLLKGKGNIWGWLDRLWYSQEYSELEYKGNKTLQKEHS